MFFVSWLLPAPEITPKGVQCPLASVQAVTVAVKCCGRVVGYMKRAPQPGDKGFVQCHCAEKKIVRQKASIEAKPIPYPTLMVVMNRIVPIPAARQAFCYSALCPSVANPPLQQPPACA